MVLTIKTTGIEDYLDPNSGNAWVQAIIVGDHGVGKTPFAANWPKPIFAMCEHGAMSIARAKVPMADIHNDRDMDEFIAAVRRDCLLPLDKRQYRTVVIDTIDAYQKRLMDHRVASHQLDRFAGWDNWDWLEAKVSRALRQLSSLPVHLIVNMHYKNVVVGEGDDKTTIKEARLKGDLKSSVYQEFDLIGFMETYYATDGGARQRRHRIRWWPEPGFEMVRCRAVGPEGVLLPQFTPVEFGPADFQVIFDAIVSGVDGLEDSEVVETVGTDVEPELPAPNAGAGPVTEPEMPPAKRGVAKKTTTKKAASKKAASPSPAAESADRAEPPSPTPTEAGAPPESANVDSAAGPPPEPEQGTDVPEPTPDPTPEPAPEPTPQEQPKSPEPATAEGPACGQQPESLVGKYEPGATGCGAALTVANKAPLAVVKYKTQLCQDCFAKAQAAA